MNYTIQVLITKDTVSLLPWWWINSSLHSNKPLHFISKINLKEEVNQWCLKHGTLSENSLKTPSILLAPYHQIRGTLDPLFNENGSYAPQSLISHLEKAKVLPPLYDCVVDSKVNDEAIILNWEKNLPLLFSQIEDLSKQYFLNLSFSDRV